MNTRLLHLSLATLPFLLLTAAVPTLAAARQEARDSAASIVVSPGDPAELLAQAQPSLTASNSTPTTMTRLTLTGHTGAWSVATTVVGSNTTCKDVTSGTTLVVTNLSSSTSYTFQAHSGTGCTSALATASVSFTTSGPPSLTASAVTQTTARLTLTGHNGLVDYPLYWYHKQYSGSGGSKKCTFVAGGTTGTTADLVSLTAGMTYTWKAYSDGNCSTEIASETFTTSVPVTLTASAITDTTATLTMTNYMGDWYYRIISPPSGECSPVPSGASTKDLTGLTPGINYSIQAYSDSGCSRSPIGKMRNFTTLGLLVTEFITDTTVWLNMKGHGGAWWFKSQTSACTGVAPNTPYVQITGLTGDTSYTYSAYSDSSCSSRLATTESFTTPKLTASAGRTGATLTLSSYGRNWSYKGTQQGAPCVEVDAGTATATVSGLMPATAYTYVAYHNRNCSSDARYEISEATFTTATASLVASAMEATTATLTITGHTGAWYYKGDQSGAQCVSVPQNTPTASLSSLSGNSNYVYKAYSDINCTTELTSSASDAEFLTKPGKPTTLMTVMPSPGSLALNFSVTGNGTLTKWQYKQKEGAGTFDANWTDIQKTATTLIHTVTGLTSGTSYEYKVRAVNATGAGAESDPSVPTAAGQAVGTGQAVPPGVVTNIAVTHNGTNLTVTWEAPAEGATHYDVTYSGGGVNARAAWHRAGTSITITCDSRAGHENQNCVAAGTAYTVGVRARNAAGVSAWSNSAQTSVQGSVPGPVTNIQVAHKGTSLAVSWDAPAGATHYDVTYYRHDTRVNARGAWNRAGSSLTITKDSRDGYDNTINSNATYTVGVRARNAAGVSAWVNSEPAAAPSLTVGDVTVAEPATGTANLDFTVTLSRRLVGTVTVDYATSDGTATAGSDYTSTSGRLSFAVGDTSKTVSVPVLADAVNEGSETLTLSLSNATGARISDGTATGTITNDGPIPAAWNARFGRTVADQVLEGVETRLRSAPTPGMELNLAGERLEWPDASNTTQPVSQQVADQLAQWLVVGSGDSGNPALRTLNGDDLLASSSFALASPVSGGGLLSFWGRGAITSFDGREGELSLDGQVTTVMLGTDWSWGQWPDGGEARRSIAGLLLSRSTADGGYTGSDAGEVDATLTGVFPWMGHRFTHQLEAWGAAGYGQGELELTRKLKDTGKNGATLTADLNLWLAAGGLRGTLLDGGNEGLTITGKGDAMAVGTSSGWVAGANDNLAATQATVTRLRLGLEAQRPILLGHPESGSEAGTGATLTPSLEVGLRHDGGDAETGFGLDLGGGIVLSHPERGLQAELRGRGLLSHASEGFRDRGFSGSLSWQQRPDSDLGAAVSLSQTMGGSSSGGADALLSRTTLDGLAANNDGSNDDLKNQRLELQLSYGLPAFGDRFTLTPEVGMGFYDSGRDYRLGWSLTQPDGGESFAFSFDVTRRESASNNDAPEHGVELRLDTLF